MILSGQVSPDGKLFAFTNTGYTHHALHIVDLATEKEIATFPMEQAWSGLAFAPEGSASSCRAAPAIRRATSRISIAGTTAAGRKPRGRLSTLYGAHRRTRPRSRGSASSADGTLLYALNNSDDQLYILETRGGRAVARLRVGDHPLSARLSKDGRTLYVANLGDRDGRDRGRERAEPSERRPARSRPIRIPTTSSLTADGRLFVSCGNTNNVIAFDLKSRQRLEVISTALGPKAPAGSTPNSLALSPDRKTLYVANADNNSVAVIDVEDRGKSKPLGFLPTGWYPTLVTTTRRRQARHRRQRQGQRHRTEPRQAADRSDLRRRSASSITATS